jgi:hypothetical protein
LEDCPKGQYCALDTEGACGAAGTCKDIPYVCPTICEPVCGCDGKTYDNGCRAIRAGTNKAWNGFCGQSPAVACWHHAGGTPCTAATAQADCNAHGNGAGYQGSVGDSNLYCKIPDGSVIGTCETIPSDCHDDGNAVYGMDGNTYDSECAAFWNGRVMVATF